MESQADALNQLTSDELEGKVIIFSQLHYFFKVVCSS